MNRKILIRVGFGATAFLLAIGTFAVSFMMSAKNPKALLVYTQKEPIPDIAFKISTKKKGMSSLELSKEFELRQKTCWEFKWKIQQAMASSLQYPLEGLVHVDEFMIGGPEEQKRGRTKGAKKLIVIVLEVLDTGVGRAYAEVIENASSKELGGFLKKYVSKDAKIISDEWRGYIPLKTEFKKLEQVVSDDGKNFKDVHIHIMNIKSWLRGIHHHCSKERMQGYLRANKKNGESCGGMSCFAIRSLLCET